MVEVEVDFTLFHAKTVLIDPEPSLIFNLAVLKVDRHLTTTTIRHINRPQLYKHFDVLPASIQPKLRVAHFILLGDAPATSEVHCYYRHKTFGALMYDSFRQYSIRDRVSVRILY